MTLAAPLTGSAVHIAIDMQRLFAEETEWYTPALAGILPNVLRIARARPAQSLYARFLVPETADHATGQWKRYYRRWSSLTGEAIDPGLLDLVAPLAALAERGSLIDKFTYSIFEAEGTAERLAARGFDTIVFTGVETDVCVLASLMDAVDKGFRVVAVADAMTSSSEAGHRATLDHVFTRMPDQIEIADTDAVLAAWVG